MLGFLRLDGDRRVGPTQASILVLGFEGNPIPFAETARHERAMPVGKRVVSIQQFARRGWKRVKRAGVESVLDDDGIEPAIQGPQLLGPGSAPVFVEPGVVAVLVSEAAQDLPPAASHLAAQPEGGTAMWVRTCRLLSCPKLFPSGGPGSWSGLAVHARLRSQLGEEGARDR